MYCTYKIYLLLPCTMYFILACILHLLLNAFIRKASNNSIADLKEADKLQEETLALFHLNCTHAEVVFKQFYIAKALRDNFKKVGVSFYENYFVFSFCSIVYTILSSAFVFLISVKGWLESDVLVQALAIETIILASFYYFLPKVLNNKANLKKNIDDVKGLQKIQFDILSFLNSCSLHTPEEKNLFVEKVYELLAARYGYNIDIDPSSIDKNPLDTFKEFKTRKP